MYRIDPPGVEGLRQFGETALRRGGVFIRTEHAPPVGTQVMVCVVHPVSGDEFRLEGDVVSVKAKVRRSRGIAVQFLRRDPAVETEYEYFVALGLPDNDRPPPTQRNPKDPEQAHARHDPDTEPSQSRKSVRELRKHRNSTIDIEVTELQIIGELTPRGIHVQSMEDDPSDETLVEPQSDVSNSSGGQAGHNK
jgi:Tfp pilus assembly protein PilZ